MMNTLSKLTRDTAFLCIVSVLNGCGINPKAAMENAANAFRTESDLQQALVKKATQFESEMTTSDQRWQLLKDNATQASAYFDALINVQKIIRPLMLYSPNELKDAFHEAYKKNPALKSEVANFANETNQALLENFMSRQQNLKITLFPWDFEKITKTSKKLLPNEVHLDDHRFSLLARQHNTFTLNVKAQTFAPIMNMFFGDRNFTRANPSYSITLVEDTSYIDTRSACVARTRTAFKDPTCADDAAQECGVQIDPVCLDNVIREFSEVRCRETLTFEKLNPITGKVDTSSYDKKTWNSTWLRRGIRACNFARPVSTMSLE